MQWTPGLAALPFRIQLLSKLGGIGIGFQDVPQRWAGAVQLLNPAEVFLDQTGRSPSAFRKAFLQILDRHFIQLELREAVRRLWQPLSRQANSRLGCA